MEFPHPHDNQRVSSAEISRAEGTSLPICPSVIIVRLSVNFCFKSLLLLQFIFNHSEFFTGETIHIVPPCNKAGILTFCLEFQKFKEDYLVLFLMCTMLFNYIIPNIRFVNISSHFNVHLPASFLLALMNSSIHLILETS